ncbi:hypothetical protein [Mycolicibacterium sp.]|jgi:hypothetical protein|uniref:hypothetical protein n=1 Tax=Mycolicibacterium sp. TaxID=2320850 RepID=UPI0028A5D956|nr:hypothetical protein [Mycolicibacterium sp.]
MSAAVRSYLTAAAMSVGTLTVAAGGPPPSAPPAAEMAYALAAQSSSLSNVPANLFAMVLSMPAWEFRAAERLADAMIATGSWQVWGPTNVGGFDEQDPPKLKAAVDMLMPVAPFSSVFGTQLSWWAQANLPMNSGCAAVPGACPDITAFMKGTFTVPAATLQDGYRFPTSTNPFTLQPTTWSGQFVTDQPGAAFTSLWNYLTGPSAEIETMQLGEMAGAAGKLAKSMVDAFYPFVQNSEWYNPRTPFSQLSTALAPALCPSCDPDNPYDNPWLYENYPPSPSAAVQPRAAAAAVSVLPATPDRDFAATAAEPVDEPSVTSPSIDRRVRSVDAEIRSGAVGFTSDTSDSGDSGSRSTDRPNRQRRH